MDPILYPESQMDPILQSQRSQIGLMKEFTLHHHIVGLYKI